MLLNKYKENVYQIIKLVKGWLQGAVAYAENIEYFSCDYKKGSDVPFNDERFIPLKGKIPGGRDNHSWVHFTVKPKVLMLSLTINPI